MIESQIDSTGIEKDSPESPGSSKSPDSPKSLDSLKSPVENAKFAQFPEVYFPCLSREKLLFES